MTKAKMTAVDGKVRHNVDAEGWPVFECKVVPWPGQPQATLWTFQCPYCRHPHKHGNGPGHRVSHCTSELGNRMMPRGYKIVAAPPPKLTITHWADLDNLPPQRKVPVYPIIYSDVTVRLRSEPLNPIVWQGRQWAVTTHGLEKRDCTYAIEAKRLWEEEPDYSWEQHIAGKWPDEEDLADLFTALMVARAYFAHLAPPQKGPPTHRHYVRYGDEQ